MIHVYEKQYKKVKLTIILPVFIQYWSYFHLLTKYLRFECQHFFRDRLPVTRLPACLPQELRQSCKFLFFGQIK